MGNPPESKSQSDLRDASIKLKSLMRENRFPELQTSLENLSEKVEEVAEFGSDEPTAAAVAALEKSVERLYRTSVAQTNAAPQKFQQPIFQSYSDYQKCVTSHSTATKKTICISLFVLSVANNLLSISLTLKR
jgi:hypothetical protein